MGLVPPLGYVLLDAFRLWCSLKKGRIVSYQDEKRRIERYIMKDLGRKPIDEITAPMVIHHVRRIEAAGHQATLKRVLMRVREIMGLAVCAGYVQHNPLERISKVFAPPIVTPMPAPDWRDFPKVLTVMRNAPTHVRLLFAWSACSMLRPTENVSLRWDWIEGDVLTIPAENMKKRRDFRLPITPLMCELLESARKISHSPRSGYVFPSRRSGRHISEQTLAKYLHSTELSGVLVAHGLRSMARSFLADHDAPFEAAEMCLSHTVGTAVSRAYQRSDYLEARRGLLQHWQEYFLACATRAEFSLDFR